MAIENILYRTQAQASGGREGRAASSDQVLQVALSTPKELGGVGGPGTNPEQLFAAAYAACFLGAIKFVAAREQIALSPEATVAADVGIGPVPTGFGIEAALQISLPGLARAEAEKLVQSAHLVCPYSHAIRNNVDVTLHIV
jgi:Ohr subfamily peroxiredoxin